MTYFIYILHSSSSDKYYIGYTNDYKRRLEEHNTSQHNTYTSKHRPWKLMTVFECGESESEAMKIEKFIKKQKSRKLIEKIISGDLLDGSLAKLIRVPLNS